MPKAFTNCVKAGGRVRTIKPTKSTHKPVCFKDGRSFAGETKRTKSRPRGR